MMDLRDDLVQSHCEMIFNGQKPMLSVGGPKCGESGELNAWNHCSLFSRCTRNGAAKEDTSRTRIQKV